MDIDTVYVRDLQSMLVCDQSDGYLKERAKYWIEEIERETSLVIDMEKVPSLTALSQHKSEKRDRHAYGQTTPLFTTIFSI